MVLPSSIIRAYTVITAIMEAVRSAKMSVSFYQTTLHNIPDIHLHIGCHVNLKTYSNISYDLHGQLLSLQVYNNCFPS
jgi:hypothetical protein